PNRKRASRKVSDGAGLGGRYRRPRSYAGVRASADARWQRQWLGRKRDPTGPLIATLAPSRNCIGADAAPSPPQKQKSPAGFPTRLLLSCFSGIYRPPVTPRALNTRGTISAFRRLAVGGGVVVVQH